MCVGGGGGGAHIHVIYVPSVKNQYKRVVFGYISGVGRCQKVCVGGGGGHTDT